MSAPVLLPAPTGEPTADTSHHRIRLDDRRCTCGLPREECVRRRVRELWST
ncbi:hypothetical protein HC031_27335 [Planosporangium thailandense]|uniref:Uncharacterized protein n=1 Tax=Planosporangium thailandense TaxID=765197 RepID=A0ABX0Y4Z6_9ACTN|nr:hypothetical protein [Planosporangium thailandense]